MTDSIPAPDDSDLLNREFDLGLPLLPGTYTIRRALDRRQYLERETP